MFGNGWVTIKYACHAGLKSPFGLPGYAWGNELGRAVVCDATKGKVVNSETKRNGGETMIVVKVRMRKRTAVVSIHIQSQAKGQFYMFNRQNQMDN